MKYFIPASPTQPFRMPNMITATLYQPKSKRTASDEASRVADFTSAFTLLIQSSGLGDDFDREEMLVRARLGLSSSVLDALAQIAPSEVMDAAIASATTRARWKQKKQNLTGSAADGALRLIGLIVQAKEAFGDTNKAIRWLSKPKNNLDPEGMGVTPFDLAKSEHGARLVEARLNQIMHGIFA